jgi:hypothetical protein
MSGLAEALEEGMAGAGRDEAGGAGEAGEAGDGSSNPSAEEGDDGDNDSVTSGSTSFLWGADSQGRLMMSRVPSDEEGESYDDDYDNDDSDDSEENVHDPSIPDPTYARTNDPEADGREPPPPYKQGTTARERVDPNARIDPRTNRAITPRQSQVSAVNLRSGANQESEANRGVGEDESPEEGEESVDDGDNEYDEDDEDGGEQQGGDESQPAPNQPVRNNTASEEQDDDSDSSAPPPGYEAPGETRPPSSFAAQGGASDGAGQIEAGDDEAGDDEFGDEGAGDNEPSDDEADDGLTEESPNTSAGQTNGQVPEESPPSYAQVGAPTPRPTVTDTEQDAASEVGPSALEQPQQGGTVDEGPVQSGNEPTSSTPAGTAAVGDGRRQSIPARLSNRLSRTVAATRRRLSRASQTVLGTSSPANRAASGPAETAASSGPATPKTTTPGSSQADGSSPTPTGTNQSTASPSAGQTNGSPADGASAPGSS